MEIAMTRKTDHPGSRMLGDVPLRSLILLALFAGPAYHGVR
jgi:hypothetical protein